MSDERDHTPIHLKHSLDGYPLCWPMDMDGEFEGTFNDAVVTCPECLDHLDRGNQEAV